jgi:2-enoate reductase
VVIGGGLVGCETALWLAENNHKVILVEVLQELMTGGLPVPHMNRQMLLDLIALNQVNVITNAGVQEITDEGIITVDKDSRRKLIKADRVVLASGLKSDDRLYQSLIGKVPNLYALGDCQRPRNIMGAIWDGYEVGRAI